MNIPEIFLHELWDKWYMGYAFAAVLLGRLAMGLASSGCATFFTRMDSFPELAAFSKDDQQMLLREASRKAFSALSFVPPLIALACWWGGWALMLTLKQVTALPVWALCVLWCLFLWLGHWLAPPLEAHRVRPFLKKLIDGQNSKTVA